MEILGYTLLDILVDIHCCLKFYGFCDQKFALLKIIYCLLFIEQWEKRQLVNFRYYLKSVVNTLRN